MRREFAVASKGIGKPDFYQKASPTRPMLGIDQREWFGLWGGTVDALSQVEVVIYAGAPGWRLNFAGGWLFSDSIVPQTAQIDIERPPLPYLPFLLFAYAGQASMTWSDPACVIIRENQNMRFLINNLDIAAHNYSLTCLGMEEKV